MAVSKPLDIAHLTSHDWWSKVGIVANERDCWPWSMSTGSHGYGQTWDGVTVRTTHVVAWCLANGVDRVPEGLTVDHECHNRICCNPAHLRLMSNIQNASDNGMATKTHCPKGHPYDEANTRVYTNHRTGYTCRKCKQCQSDYNASRYRKNASNV